MVQRLSYAVLAAIASVLALVVVFLVPPIALLRIAHFLPVWVEPRVAIVAAQSVLLASLFAGLRVRHSVQSGRVTAGGLRSAGWMTLAAFLLSLLIGVTLASGDANGASGGRAAELLAKWKLEFPRSGMPGRLVVMVMLAPMIEEFFFRGLVIGHLMRHAPSWFALTVSSILFALGHDSGILSALFALAVGLLYLRYRNLWLCVLAHGAHNLLAAIGAPLLAAHLADRGMLMSLGYWTLPVQLVWFGTVLACAAMFLRCVFGKIGGRSTLLLGQPVDGIGRAPT